jgi:hypothetical protein
LLDSDDDGYAADIDCDDSNATIKPLWNNSLNYIDTNTILCPGYYNRSQVILNNSNIYFDCNNAVLDGYNNTLTMIETGSTSGVNISNCNITKADKAIHLKSGTTNAVLTNNILSGTYSLLLEDVHDNHIDNIQSNASLFDVSITSNSYNNIFQI